jgi:hypothetical protein
MRVLMTLKRSVRRCVLLASLSGAAAMGGCSSSAGHAGSADSFRANPSPAMHSLGNRYDDRANSTARALDTNFRAFHDDWDRFWLIDRPSRLHKNLKP